MAVCQEILRNFSKIFPNSVQSLPTWVLPLGCKVRGLKKTTVNLCSFLLTTIILYHTFEEMSSGNFAQTFRGKMPRSVQIAQNGLARPSPSRPVFRTKRKSPEQSICSGILLRGLSCGKSDLARSPSSVNSMVEVFQHVLRIVLIFIIIHYNNLIYPIS